jgi:DNA-binding CsgD family transcriptional regulator
MDCDPGASRMLEAGRLARKVADGRLRFLYPEAEALIEEVIAQRHPPAEPRGAWLSDDPPVQMLVMRPPDQAMDSLATPHCLILMRRMIVGTSADGRFLPALFRLTRSEAALAARIAGGASLVEAAEGLGLTIETARNYSKRIYVKTGARGQADLVRIVLEGVRLPG